MNSPYFLLPFFNWSPSIVVECELSLSDGVVAEKPLFRDLSLLDEIALLKYR